MIASSRMYPPTDSYGGEKTSAGLRCTRRGGGQRAWISVYRVRALLFAPLRHPFFFIFFPLFARERETPAGTHKQAKLPSTHSSCIGNTLPFPPNLSFPAPNTTLLIPICRSAEAHMMHGSTVT